MTGEQRLRKRLGAFVGDMERIAKTADQTWIEGGLHWRVECLKVKDGSFDAAQDLNAHFEQCVRQWAILLWYVHGCPREGGADMSDLEISPDDVAVFVPEAEQMLRELRPRNGMEKSGIRMRIDCDCVTFDIAFASGRDLLAMSGQWSID